MRESSIEKAFEKFSPSSCVFVLSIDENKKPGGMVASWHMRCSQEPQMHAVALWKLGNTQKLISESKEFVISVPNKSLEKEVKFFGNNSGKNIDKFKETKIKTQKSSKIKTPILTDATINLECKLVKKIDTKGDCFIFIGEVVAAHINEKKDKILFTAKKGDKRSFLEIW